MRRCKSFLSLCNSQLCDQYHFCLLCPTIVLLYEFNSIIMDNKVINIYRYTAAALLLLTGVNAIIAGIMFIVDPSGGKMGMSTSYLVHSPFKTFLIPGIILLIVNGILNMVAGIAAIKKYNRYGMLILFQGLLLSGWIIIQVVLVKDINALHLVMLSIGIVLSATGFVLQRPGIAG